VYPGKSAHIDWLELVNAGLTPYEALATGTGNAGRILGNQMRGGAPFGTIAVGSRAYLVLLESDPATDIRNVASIAGVIANGTWFARATLDSLRARLEGAGTR
jgi:imidazolonepropionase-like amidohydrolase